jgi:type IV secretion system protein VirB10
MSANTNATAANSVENDEQVDRDIPNLTTKKKKTKVTRLAIAGGMLVALLVIATGSAMFMKRLETKKQEQVAEKAKERPKESAPVAKNFDAAKMRIKQEELLVPASAVTTMASEIPVTAAAIGTQTAGGSGQPGAAGNGTVANGQSSGAPMPTLGQRRLSGDVLVNLGGASGMLVNVADNTGTTAGFAGGTPPKNGFDEKLKPSQLIAGVAAQRPDLSMLLRRGTSIPCGQKTKIVTTHPGMVSCVISKDVYSADGKVLLVERGSEAFGEQRSAMMQGEASIEVLWTRIDTPKGVAIDINSLGTDSLGASGHPAEVDNHLMQRFGGAVMLSLISDFGQALSNRASDGNATLRLTTTSTAGQDLATKALENTINIPPTGYSQQGAAINIFVARDMDFRSVYELARY